MFQEKILLKEIVRLCFHFNVSRRALAFVQTVKEPTLCLQNLLIRHVLDQGMYEDVLSLYRKLQNLYCGSDNYTYPSVIKACTFLSASQTGKEIHCHILRNGYGDNVVLRTALMDSYAKNGNMEAACHVFDGISKRDLVCWNALLSGYSSNGLDHKAFEVFQEIHMRLNPNLITFVSTIPVCTRLGAFEVGKSIHGLGVKFGLSSDESFLPALISMYSECEDLSAARLLFGSPAEKNVVIWNSMISALTQNKDSGEALKLFQQMCRTHLRPDLVTFISVLPSCDTLVNVGESIHACTIKHGFEHQTSITTALISMYTKIEDLEAAKFLFDQMSHKTCLSWNSIISGYVKNGFPQMVLAALWQMQLEGLKPDSVSIIGALSACSELKDMQSGRAAHGYALRNGYDWNINLLNALLHFYSDSDRFSYTLKLFNVMPLKNIVSWNILIAGAARSYDMTTAIAFLNEMQRENVKFDLVTAITILPNFCQSGDLILGMSIHGMMLKMGFGSDVSLVNALITMYCNCGNLEHAHLLFNGMPVKSIVTWNALVTGHRYCNLHTEVVNLFNQMKIEGQKPNDVTLLNILPSCQSEIQGQSIHAFAIRTGFILHPSLLTSLICMYDGFENLNSCLLLFTESEKRNVVVWNVIMNVLIRNKHARKTCSYFSEMLSLGVEPDSITMLSLISACMLLASLDLAKSIMGYILPKGLESEIFVANALIDLYARCGDLLMAREIFDKMKVKDVVSWSVIINAYGIRGNGNEALNLFSIMEFCGYEPDDITFIGVLSACSHSGLVEEGQKLFKSMVEEYKILPRMEHYACMVDLLARAGYLDEAFEFVKRLPAKPSVSMLESLTGACRVHGNAALGEEIAGLVTELGPESSGSYVVFSNVYAAAGRWSDVFRLRSDMGGTGLTKVPGFSLVEA
ncbi:pentatricopeptide repeat-containing protein At3g16610-like [Aristolochia californica]|uniref:pentatricopeptide repeat-containing protein At3g16610-like n=1 Tax=Aristolochia californica TaxID=171875 RepID=UPI0035D936F3